MMQTTITMKDGEEYVHNGAPEFFSDSEGEYVGIFDLDVSYEISEVARILVVNED